MSQREQFPTTSTLRRAVLTGSAGFIGSHLAQALAQAGTTVIGVDRRDSSTDPACAANLAALRGHPRYHHVTADLCNCAIDPLLIDADAVFQLAAIPGVRPSWGPQFGDYLASNVLATHRILEACTRISVPRLVVASSSSVYGATDGAPSAEDDRPMPASPYAITKLAEEQLCLAYAERPGGPNVVALRYFSVYGPRQRSDMFTHCALHAGLTGKPLHLYGDGRQQRGFTYIDDAVAATIAAAVVPTAHGTINVGGGSTASLLDVIDIVTTLISHDIHIEQDEAISGDVLLTRADPTRARKVLGWHPQVDLHNGIHAHMQEMATTASYRCRTVQPHKL
ncbi:NAD-dependent epimerase/dehydratase family protein [Actinoplanes sp. NPDC089786]|uniref:NAD-dependent epimerase/dehydratase family protein n=1 Tax=Actinoplanes sp. NPDC089786 TaxID=3155185 RepID=UPI0034465D41